MKTLVHSLLAASAFVALGAAAARADAVSDFYRGKQISMIAPAGVGGGYDLYTRFLARYFGKFIPGQPSMVVKNMPGAGGIVAANHMYSVAPADGLTIAMFQNTVTLNQLAAMPSVKFDVRKFTWIGNMSVASTICAMSGAAKEIKAKDLFEREYVIGASSGSANMIPLLLNSLAGTKLKVVAGYVSTSNVQLAMESGEVTGLCGWSWDGARVNGRDMFARDSARVVIDIAIQPQPELQKMGVPFLMDMMPESDNKEALKVILSTQVYNRPFAGPPGVPAERVAVLRKAFADTLNDQEVKAEADKLGLDVAYLPSERILELINLALGAPQRIQAKAVEELNKAGF
ncbi:MAG: efflux transporter protein [Hyphomicrobiales bacterium]|jgi:tripartite-type tricarboxylate transporter receptor subunit TctC|nr:efflux transporter protein [Hyphomicrobiales bacterium]